MSSRRALLISVVLAVLIPLPLFGLGNAIQYHPEAHRAFGVLLETLTIVICPSSIMLIDNPIGLWDTIAALSIVLTVNAVYYSAIGTFVWLGFNYNRAFWIPVGIVVPVTFMIAFS